MEWHESLRRLLSKANEEEGDEESKQPPPPARVADLLVVDNAKPHRSLQESQSTVAETQVSPGSSINEEELSVLFEEIDIYGDDEECADFHRSFPVTRSRKRRRRRLRGSNANENFPVSLGQGNMEMLSRWASTSDSMIDYNSLDDMLRGENSQTSSARLNVFQPARRQSFEAALSEVVADMSEVADEDDEDSENAMDSKPAARPKPG